ncbi:MAG: glycosyltransferase family 2 protein [Cyclobacteriaceae bacterium]
MFKYSVIIPVYNAENFVEKAVDSALYHSTVKEVLLVEDGSTDESLLVCEKLASSNERVKLFRHADGQNKGAGASRNLGLENSSCEFICFLDADDYYLPNRFAKEKEIFSLYPEADGVYGALDSASTGEKNRLLSMVSNTSDPNESIFTTTSKRVPPEKLFEHLIHFRRFGEGYFSIVTLTIRAESIRKTNISFNEELRLHQDTDFIWKLAYCLKLYPGELERAIALRGVHPDNRFLNNKNIDQSRRLLYESAYNWAEKGKIESNYRSHFRHYYFVHDIRQEGYKKTLLDVILINNWSLIKNSICYVLFRFPHFMNIINSKRK